MVNTVTFPPEIGGDGSTVTDDSSPTTGLANGGFRTRLLPMFTQIVNVVNWFVARGNSLVNTASTHVDDATTQANNAAASAANAQIYAAAAQSAAGLPALAGHANAPLQVKPDASGVKWLGIGVPSGVAALDPNGLVPAAQLPTVFNTGDTITTANAPASPAWLKCDGSVYLQSNYAVLFAKLGILSNPGAPWTQRTLPTNAYWSSVTYGNGVFVAVVSSSNITATSLDGITWTQRALPVSGSWSSVTYGNGVFVAVMNGGSIAATSPDGITWTQRALPVSGSWSSVTYGNGVFVAVVNGSSIAATLTAYAYNVATQFAVPLLTNAQGIPTYIKTGL